MSLYDPNCTQWRLKAAKAESELTGNTSCPPTTRLICGHVRRRTERHMMTSAAANHGPRRPLRPATIRPLRASGRITARSAKRRAKTGTSARVAVPARGRHAERGVAVEEAGRPDHEAGPRDRHHRPVLGPDHVRRPERMPHDDVLPVDVPVGRGVR